jgi:hypothetical protein
MSWYFRVGIGTFRANLAATGDCTANARPDGDPDQWGELPVRHFPTLPTRNDAVRGKAPTRGQTDETPF